MFYNVTTTLTKFPWVCQVGSYNVTVTAFSPQGPVQEEVVLWVLAAVPPSGTITGQKNQQDLHVVGGGGVSGTRVPGTSSIEPPSAGEAGGSLTVISILAVVGIVPVVVAFLWCWRRHRKLPAAQSKVRCLL